MWHTTKRTCANDCTYIFKVPIMSNHWPLNAVVVIYFRTKIPPISFTMPTLPARLPATLQHAFFKMENSLFTPHLDELFNLWNNTVCWMNYLVHAAGRYRSTSILEKVLLAFFNYYQFNAMTQMPHNIILARMMTTLDMEFKRAWHYHNEGYKSDSDYGLPPQITRPIHMYSAFTTEASFDLADFTTAQHPISPFTPRHPRSLPLWGGVCWYLTFNKTAPLMPETDSEDDKELLPTADLGWD